MIWFRYSSKLEKHHTFKKIKINRMQHSQVSGTHTQITRRAQEQGQPQVRIEALR